MTREEAKEYFIDSNERIITVAKDENRYNYKTQQIEDVYTRRDFEAKELAIKALEQLPKLQNRCYVLTHGVTCGFCPYECEYRSEVEPQERNDKK